MNPDAKSRKPSLFGRFLNGIETVGNRLPHPITLFALFALAVVIVSAVCEALGVSATGEIINVKPNLTAADIRIDIKDIVKSAKEMVSLTDADIICSGGRGLGDASGFELIKQFADKVGGVVGSSRAAVDAGWIDHSHQVGQTGTTVKPKIYFACGISGAIQHLAGMQNSDCIVAINKDADAPIMEIADYAIVGDLYKVIPEIIKEWDNAEALYDATTK